jgi:flagellar biosynthesis component FlhA
MKDIEFNPVDITDTLVILSLGIGFILSIIFNMNELAMSIASGFFGYVGGVANSDKKKALEEKKQENKEETPEERRERRKKEREERRAQEESASNSDTEQDDSVSPV